MTILSQGHASANAPAAACTALRDVAVSILPGPPPPAAECQCEDLMTIFIKAAQKVHDCLAICKDQATPL